MCRAARCRQCGKTTWAGCGQHIAQVAAAVPAPDWCPGGHPSPSGSAPARGWVRRLIRR